jgi:L,D-transpeptidase catalytic domain
MSARFASLVVVFFSCHGAVHSTVPAPVTAPVIMTVIPPPAIVPTTSPAANPPYMAGIRSVVLLKDTALHKQPQLDSELVGIVRRGTHAGVKQAIDANECGTAGRWIELAPRGWTCETSVEPSETLPTAAVDVELDDDHDDPDPIRGVYGMVRGHASAFASREDVAAQANAIVLDGSNTVRAAGVVAVDGHRYWRTSQGTLIDEASIYQISPSRFKGVAIADPSALPAWVRAHGDPYKPAVTRDAPHGKPTGTLARRTVVTPLEFDGSWVRVADATWIARADLRIATLAEPPPGTGADEKWFDIDRDEQVLVAYVGTRPVYATLVSTGKWQHETQVGVARIASKHETAVMTSYASKGAVYSVADVPWTMYYDRDFALHTSYWHDGFGGVMSHGCVNLAPRDASLLYRWSSPDVPPGWTTIYGDVDNPGSLVRVRSRATPEPEFRGYARKLI